MKNFHISDTNLQLFLEGMLPPDEKNNTQKHLDSCPQCRKALAEYTEIYELLDGKAELLVPEEWTQKAVNIPRQHLHTKKSIIRSGFFDFALVLLFLFSGLGSLFLVNHSLLQELVDLVQSLSQMMNQLKTVLGGGQSLPLLLGGTGIVLFYVVIDWFRQTVKTGRASLHQ